MLLRIFFLLPLSWTELFSLIICYQTSVLSLFLLWRVSSGINSVDDYKRIETKDNIFITKKFV
jgi:hypothetical protein